MAVNVARDDFLAHACFARNQHRRIELGHALGQFHHPLKLAAANLHGGDLRTGPGVLQLLLATIQLQFLLAQLGGQRWILP